MRVALVNLTSGGLSGGSRKYLLELVPLLRAHRAVRDLHVFLPPSVRETVAGGNPGPPATVSAGSAVFAIESVRSRPMWFSSPPPGGSTAARCRRS